MDGLSELLTVLSGLGCSRALPQGMYAHVQSCIVNLELVVLEIRVEDFLCVYVHTYVHIQGIATNLPPIVLSNSLPSVLCSGICSVAWDSPPHSSVSLYPSK